MLDINLILDLDGTLIELVDDIRTLPKPRPHLHIFLDWCFLNFQHVSIWSAASSDWVKEMLIHIQASHYPFHFIWADKHITRTKNHVIKKLWKVCREYPEYTLDNTLILDDTPSTYKNNYGNGIGIMPYHQTHHEDKELWNLMFSLAKWIGVYSITSTVRNINKGAFHCY